jgi:lipopolysaccharide export system permease protein
VKILDKYLLKTFLITFATVFVILFFIFILQTVWLFIAQLAGKDLDFVTVIKFLLFSMPRIIPLVLPLSVALASIMTFGSFAENYEFAAMKSAGISLKRSMRSISYFIIVLSIIAFSFANNVIPYAEYKFINFMRNIAQVKPTLAIAEGQFSKVGNYVIKVEKKSGEKENILTGITIHKQSFSNIGNTTVIKAKNGELISDESSNVLKMVLFNGYYYEDIPTKNYESRKRVPFAKATFSKDVINIDLSKMNKTPEDQGQMTSTNNMLNLNELSYTIDSLNQNYSKDIKSFTENIYQRAGVISNYNTFNNAVQVAQVNSSQLLDNMDVSRKREILKIATNTVENTGFSIDSSIIEMTEKQKNINRHWVAYYEKFVIAFSCILMFFIGAPLGAIIRKGGLGMPIVSAVSVFIIFHFINTFGKKLAQENSIPPILGAWLSTLVLLPLAVFLTYRAINDIGGMFTFDVITSPIQHFFKKIFRPKIQE